MRIESCCMCDTVPDRTLSRCINDPLVGFIIDHLPTRKMGHFRPTLILGTILCSVNFLLLWFGPMLSTSGKLAIAYVSYILLGVLFPVMDISLNSLLPVMTEDMNYRNTSIVGLAAPWEWACHRHPPPCPHSRHGLPQSSENPRLSSQPWWLSC